MSTEYLKTCTEIRKAEWHKRLSNKASEGDLGLNSGLTYDHIVNSSSLHVHHKKKKKKKDL